MRAIGVTTAHSDAELLAAGAERTIADFQGLEWSRIAQPVSTAGFWDGLYADGQDGWDLGEPAPALGRLAGRRAVHVLQLY